MAGDRTALRRGIISGLTCLGLLALALLPSRLSVAMHVRGGTAFERLTRALSGTALDLSAILLPVAGLLLLAVVLFRFRAARWQRLGLPLLLTPAAAALCVLTVAEQEVKAERGAFSTLHELTAAAGELSFVEGSLDFLRYQRIWMPVLGCAVAAVALLLLARRGAQVHAAEWRPWAVGFGGVLLLSAPLVPGLVAAQGALSSRLRPAALGDPLRSLVETTVELARGTPPPKPSDLLLQLQPGAEEVATGLARLGWPPRAAPGAPCRPHPHARPLDRAQEPPAPGAPLLAALEHLSALLFPPEAPPVAVFQFSLESFRADDVHAFNPNAPRALHPFVNGLMDKTPGVLSSRRTYQAGVRTAQGLAAMTCGLGTLPYNLSLIRDLDDFPLRCAPDVLASAGFAGTFFYGSDASYDQMSHFLQRHGVARVVSQDELPPTSPRGAWSGVTDFALFDAAVDQVKEGLATRPQLALVMSLSNHSPYTPPDDLPAEVSARVDEALKGAVHRASPDERRRLLTHAYTDAALERFFARLDATGLAAQSVVVLLADHSTGEDYVWGADTFEHETDEAKARVPFALVIPPSFLARLADQPALQEALSAVQQQLDATVLSQNDVPALLLALLSANPALVALPEPERWHTLGGQVTSPWFRAGGEAGSFIVGINGVDELYALDREGHRVGSYEDVVFLRTKAERDEVTPRLIPIGAALVDTLKSCPPSPPGGRGSGRGETN